MNKIQHHPSDDILLRYVSGGLETAYNLALATHVSMCSQCQKSVQKLQSIGGHVLDESDTAEISISAQDLLAMAGDIKIEESVTRERPKSTKLGIDIPAVLSDYIGDNVDGLKWQNLSPGLKQYRINVEGKATARFLWMRPGKAVPAHGHTGEELTMVLSGGYFDGDEPFIKGDLQWAEHKAPHMPTAMEDAPCLVLAVTDSPLVFRNLIPRLLQPFFKI